MSLRIKRALLMQLGTQHLHVSLGCDCRRHVPLHCIHHSPGFVARDVDAEEGIVPVSRGSPPKASWPAESKSPLRLRPAGPPGKPSFLARSGGFALAGPLALDATRDGAQHRLDSGFT